MTTTLRRRKTRCRQWALVMVSKETGRTRVLLFSYLRKRDILEYVRDYKQRHADDDEQWRFAVVRPE